MEITFFLTGDSKEKWIKEALEHYVGRVSRYVKFTVKVVRVNKCKGTLPVEMVKQQEGKQLLKAIDERDFLLLLDEKGQKFTSKKFAFRLQQIMNAGHKRVVFVIGGAYGFSEALYERSNEIISLSDMTFSHQIVRVLFAEQLYRAFTILNNEPYHHD